MGSCPVVDAPPACSTIRLIGLASYSRSSLPPCASVLLSECSRQRPPRGAISQYPLDSKTWAQGGKLRLLYEANPLRLIVEQACGASTTWNERILDIQPHKLHQRVPVILSSKNEVERVTGYHK